MMQAFRNAAKPLMVVVAFTFFAWLVLDLSGITGGTGLLTRTAVGKVNGQSIDARTYQSVVQQSIDARQRQAPGALGMDEYAQIRDEVWEQFVQSTVLQAEYQRRLLFNAFVKFVGRAPKSSADPARSYRWVELGRGRVDLPGVFAALKKAGFKGWAVVELDAVPDKTRTPKDSGQISKSYLEKQGFRIEDGGRA